MSPSFVNMVPRIAINFSPNDVQAVDRAFSDWTEVSRWASKLYDPQVIVDDTVAAKAQELTVPAEPQRAALRLTLGADGSDMRQGGRFQQVGVLLGDHVTHWCSLHSLSVTAKGGPPS